MAQRKKYKTNQKCKLFPYKTEEIVSLQNVMKQRKGWSITAFDLPKTWKLTKGEGVKIAILDTGCDLNHPDLVENLLPGFNLLNPRKPPHDDNCHGTHIAGIIAASNNKIGMVGVAPKAKIIPIKVLDAKGSGNLNNVAKGIRIAVGLGADIICMSLGAPRPLQQVRKAIQFAASKGIPTFVAAGNAGRTKEVFYPAAYPETIAIGSIDKNLRRSSFSNTGKNLDFMAPGGKIFSTVPDNWYAFLQGTSQACPFAAAVAALVLSYTKSHNVNIPLNSVEDYRRIFRKHTIPVSNKKFAGKKFFEGFGIIDPRKLREWIVKYK